MGLQITLFPHAHRAIRWHRGSISQKLRLRNQDCQHGDGYPTMTSRQCIGTYPNVSISPPLTVSNDLLGLGIFHQADHLTPKPNRGTIRCS